MNEKEGISADLDGGLRDLGTNFSDKNVKNYYSRQNLRVQFVKQNTDALIGIMGYKLGLLKIRA